ESKDHKVKRPMNAFILYRKAWQNRIKKWQTHENHQAISKVAGDGWAYESEEVKAQYAELARVEREMHTQAFPQYKFTPAKTKKARK
ncbi:high mobility group box domain-containing protein, partial [Xylariales sp. AK1849]